MAKNNILIVDDESINLDILRNILSHEYNVHVAKGGVSALEMVGKVMPDIILLDIIMPDMNGFEVLDRLKKTEKTRDIPVIIITTLYSNEDEVKGLKLGAVDFISKPFNFEIVRTRVHHHVQFVNQIRAIEQYSHNLELTLSSRLEAIVNNYNGVIWSVDKAGVITYFNGQYLNKIGIASSFLVGKNIESARKKYRHLDFVDNIEKTFREGSQDWLSEIDGLVFKSHTTLIRDDEGNVTGIVGNSDDVTELIKLQRDMEAAAKAAEAANRSKSSFLAKMSHEIRTPLNAVLGIAEVQLQNETLQPDIKEGYIRIFHSGDLLLGIINDILDMSKIEAGKLELTNAKYDIASLINDTVYLNMIKHEEKPVKLILNVDEKIPSELIGDKLRIKQILNNLLSNAFKYTRDGEVELSINAESGFVGQPCGDSVTLVFHVRDTGQGMTPDQVERIFDEYSRFIVDFNRTTEGTGLGMGITQNLVRMMNGDIQVKSELGKGSLFTVRLPQNNIGAVPLGKETVERLKQFHLIYEAKMEKLQIAREPIPFGKVLVVDDMEMNLYVTKGMLSPYGLQIDTAASGFEAIEKVKRNMSSETGQYDLVFMDHMMPIMDGVEAVQEIRKWEKEEYKRKHGKLPDTEEMELPEGSRLPIIALTANAVSGMKEMFLSKGFSGFISKPVILQELDEVLKKWLSLEKITEYQKPQGAETDETHDSFLQEVKKIGEIDTEIGLNQIMGNKAMYRNTLEIFYKKLIPICNDMNSSLNGKDIKSFAISVHSMKSMLAIIGVLSLSATALELEIAAENSEIDFCTRLFTEFKEKLLKLREKLSAVFSDTGEKPKGETMQKFQNIKVSGKQKVLLVDDTEMILYVIKEKLLSYGLQVDTASSGPEAIEKVKNNMSNEAEQYDLVFMDQKMPKMTGLEAVNEIRKLEYEKFKLEKGTEFTQETPKLSEAYRLPIIALTAAVTLDMENTFLAAGFNGFLSKPIENKKLETIFKQWLKNE